MHILYLTYSLPSPSEPGVSRPWQMKEFWLRRGYRLTVITGARHYMRVDDAAADAGGGGTVTESGGPLTIHRVYSTRGRRRSLRRRVLNYLTFTTSSLVAGLRTRDIDVVYCRTPPILINLAGWIVARLKGARFVLEIGDLHPDESVALGLIRSRPLIAIWEAWENFFRRRADLIVAVVPGIKTMLEQKGFPAAKIHVATNAYDPPADGASPAPMPDSLREHLAGRDGTFVAAYAGSMGKAISLGCIIDAAALLRDRQPRFNIVFVGDGDLKPRLIERCEREEIDNVSFFDPIPADTLPSFLGQVDALFHSVYRGVFHGYNLPNKFFTYMGSSKPIVFAGTGIIAEIIEEARCGIVVEPESAEGFAAAIEKLSADPELARAMGRRAREYVLEHFDRARILTTLDERMRRLLEGT